MKLKVLVLMTLLTPALSIAQDNRIDTLGANAPSLAPFGPHAVGVRTLELVNPQQVDVSNSVEGEVTNYYDRRLTVEVWYPATLAAGQVPGTDYSTETRNVDVLATLHGRALRDAAPDASAGAYPLVILSHGYPGNRYLMSHLGENLASKGYVVASIDHTESTYRRQDPIASTLYNRPFDQRFVLEQMAELGADGNSFLSGLVDADKTGLIGFSMGGYGLVNNFGGAVNPAMIANAISPPNEILEDHSSRNRRYRRNLDARFKAGVAIAPWGMNTGYFTPETVAGIDRPVLFVAGSVDKTAGYEEGTRAIFENAKGADRYLLTFEGGGHSVAAPIPVPSEVMSVPEQRGAGHYTDAHWNSVTANNILQHFVTAFFDLNLKGEQAMGEYLNDSWKGFAPGAAAELRLEHLGKGQ